MTRNEKIKQNLLAIEYRLNVVGTYVIGQEARKELKQAQAILHNLQQDMEKVSE